MPLKTIKKDAADSLTLEWVLHVKNYKLTLDKKRCVGCQVCTLACPKEAIKTTKPAKVGGKAQKPQVDIELSKCNFCAICDVTCPYGAIQVTVNGNHDPAILAKDSYPQLTRDIVVDTAKCDKTCTECETACPLKLIKITKTTFDGKPLSSTNGLSPIEKKRIQLKLDIQKDGCPTCAVCEHKCPSGVLKVKKAFEGTITINPTQCPEGCHDCQDVCPIPGTLTMGEDNKIRVNDVTCTFCGACKNICPVPEALTVKRTKVFHTPIHSGTWNKALARITSEEDAAKELDAQATQNRRAVVEKRFESEALKTEDLFK